jgi:uncharacterized protein
MLHEILFFISAIISEIIVTAAGFGSSTIFLPIALFFVDFKTALVLVAVFHLFGNLGRINLILFPCHRNKDGNGLIVLT